MSGTTFARPAAEHAWTFADQVTFAVNHIDPAFVALACCAIAAVIAGVCVTFRWKKRHGRPVSGADLLCWLAGFAFALWALGSALFWGPLPVVAESLFAIVLCWEPMLFARLRSDRGTGDAQDADGHADGPGEGAE